MQKHHKSLHTHPHMFDNLYYQTKNADQTTLFLLFLPLPLRP